MLLSLESPVFYILAQSASIQMCFVTSQNFLEEVLKRKSFENIFLAWKTSWQCSGCVHFELKFKNNEACYCSSMKHSLKSEGC